MPATASFFGVSIGLILASCLWGQGPELWNGSNVPSQVGAVAGEIPLDSGHLSEMPDRPAVSTVAIRFQEPSTDRFAEANGTGGPPLNTIEGATKRLEAIQADAAMDSAVKERLVESLNAILESLRRRAADAEEVTRHRAALEDVASRITQAHSQAEVPPEPVVGPSPYLPIVLVREGKVEADAEVAAARDRLQRLLKTIQERQVAKETLPTQIQKERTRISELESTPVPEQPDGADALSGRVMEAKRVVDLEAARERLRKLTLYQRLIDAENELLPLQEKVAKSRLQRAEAHAKAWSEALSKRRESQLQGSLSRYKAELEREGIDPQKSLVLSQESLREYWHYIVGETAQYEQQLTREASRAEGYQQTLTDIQEQIEEHRKTGRALGGSLGLQLRLEKNSLPPVREITREVADIDAKIEVAEVKRAEATLVLESARRYADESFGGGGTIELPQLNGEVHPTEERLLGQYLEDVRGYYSAMIKLRAALDAKREAVESLRATIDAHVLWVPNHSRFRIADLSKAWLAMERIFHPAELKIAGQAIITGLLRRPDLLLLSLLSLGMLLLGGRRVRRRLSLLGKAASPMQVVSLRPTWYALLLTVVQSIPLPLLLWTLGQAVRVALEAGRYDLTIASGLELAAAAVLPVEFLRQIVRPNGLLTAHFGVVDATVRPLRFGLRVLIDVGLPLVILWSVAQRLGSMGIDASLGRVVFCLGMLLLSYITWRAIHPRSGLMSKRLAADPQGWLARLRYIWLTVAVGLPLVLAVLSLAGYAFGAVSLLVCGYGTLWLGIFTLLTFGFVKRWLLTQRRRLAVTARLKRIEAMESGLAESGEAVEDAIDISEINAQTSRLLRTGFGIIALIGLTYIWAPVFPAVDYLQRFPLPGMDGESGVTLASLVKALPVLIITWVAVRNLPGLMEGLLLDQLPLQKAARYAITSLTTYALAAIGVIWAAQTLGFRWQSIQWLVAALGVGLGFGLQEIFANFVSGLILLFEQPIRVGDVVTIGDTTGKVSRIRIRATTVTNWDRQELVIPNKDLITGRLINWSLTDSLNRVVIEVGVAYGSDTRLACRLLSEIGAGHPNVSKDPAPIVTFEKFGGSSLHLVMRCYLPDLDNRLATIHDLHTMINDRFRDAGIEIAFPQQDLHIRSLPPELLRAAQPHPDAMSEVSR